MMLCIPYRKNENVLKKKCDTWFQAYLSQKSIVYNVEREFFPRTTPTWGDIDLASKFIASKNNDMFMYNGPFDSEL